MTKTKTYSMTLTPVRFARFDPDADLPDRVISVEICLGANPAAARHVSRHLLPCVVYPRLASGATLGTGAHGGFVSGYSAHDLERLGFAGDAIYFAAGANVATLRDLDSGGAPLCEHCHREGGAGKVSKRHSRRRRPCWCCSRMIDESWAEDGTQD